MLTADASSSCPEPPSQPKLSSAVPGVSPPRAYFILKLAIKFSKSAEAAAAAAVKLS
jgi:hypothetical protein